MTAQAASPVPPSAAARLRLAELLATRLCHDLSGAVGTVSGALDLALQDPACAAEATSLAASAASTLAARLRLLRAAWGAAAPLAIADFPAFTAGLPRPDVTLSLDLLAGPGSSRGSSRGSSPGAMLPPPAARLLVNLLLLAAESLPRGGIVALSGDIATEVIVTIDGPNAAWPPGLAAWLADADSAWAALDRSIALPLAARRLQGPLTVLIAGEAGLRVSMPLPIADNAPPPPLLVALARRE
jgi:histidine phosphotransferase ChpT